MKRGLLPLIGLVTLFSGCTHYFYAPNTQNVPVFKEKGEARVSGSYTASDKIGGDIQAAYAVTNHVAVLANATIIQPDVAKMLEGRGYLYETGAGYFDPLRSKNRRVDKLFVFELYGFVGLGGYQNYYWDNTGQTSVDEIYANGHDVPAPPQFLYPNNYITTRFLKAYMQPSISLGHNIVDLIFSSKIGFMYTYGITSTLPAWALATNTSGDGTPASDWYVLHTYNRPFVCEPAITLRLGFKYVKVQCQVAFIADQGNTFMNKLGYPATESIGLSLEIANRFRKSKKEPPTAPSEMENK